MKYVEIVVIDNLPRINNAKDNDSYFCWIYLTYG